MGRSRSIRVWTELDVDEIRKHLLYIDDLYGTCGSCKQLGLNYVKDKSCKKCGAVFKYLATTIKNPAETAKILARLHAEKLPFKLIDREDFERASAKDAIGDLFSKS